MARVAVLLFVKYPVAGAVNTRMTPPLTGDEASQLHAASMRAVCGFVIGLGSYDVIPVVSPDDRASDLAALLSDELPHLADKTGLDDSIWPQGGGSLGERLARSVQRAFTGGARGVILLGGDSPTLPRRWLMQAGERLADHDAVMGPTDDGGYYLLGMRRPLVSLFDGIDWGGADVAAQTRQRAVEAGIDLYELPPWYDLDRFTDLRRAAEDLAEEDCRAACRLRDLIVLLIERYGGG